MKKIKILASILSAAVLSVMSVVGASAAHYKGDVDRDDDVTINDISSVQKAFVGKGIIESDKKIYVDMNDDGKYNVFDLILMKRVCIGEAPMEEVPSLTTPPETTTTTTTTEVVTTATTAESTTTTEETSVTQETTITSSETLTTTTLPEETITTEEVTTTVSEEPITTEEVTTTIPQETTTTTTPQDTDDKEITTTMFGLEAGGLESIPLDSTKDIDYMELQLGTENSFTKLHMYIDNWSMWVNIKCEDGVLSQTGDERMIESVLINGDKVTIKFKEGLSGEILYFKSDEPTNTIDVKSVKIFMAGDKDTPVVTTTTTNQEETTTTTTTTEVTTTTTEADASEAVSGTAEVIPNGDVKVTLDSEKSVDSISMTFDTNNNFALHFYLGNWDAWFNIKCENGVLTYDENDKKSIESVDIQDNKVVVKFTEGIKVSSATFHQNNGGGNIIIKNYTIAMTQ